MGGQTVLLECSLKLFSCGKLSINLETVVNLSCLLIYQKSFVPFRIIYRRKRQPSGRGAFAVMTVRCQSVTIHNICHNLYIKIAASKFPRKYRMKRDDGSVCLKYLKVKVLSYVKVNFCTIHLFSSLSMAAH